MKLIGTCYPATTLVLIPIKINRLFLFFFVKIEFPDVSLIINDKMAENKLIYLLETYPKANWN
jgi:hypothetical protein